MATVTENTKQLKTLLAGVDCDITGDTAGTPITGLCSDSRKMRPGNLYAALEGLVADGHKFIDQAVAGGCAALLVNRGRLDDTTPRKFPRLAVIEVDDTKTALGSIAANYYDHPDRQLSVIGITGTNGKTTTSYLVESMLKACGKRPGVIGTVNYRYTGRDRRPISMAAPFTTPESPILFGLLRRMADENITDVIMEVSSHALAQSRLAGMQFDIGVFTNLSRDHLDYHPDMEHYFSSKKLLFTDHLKPGGRVVIVLDEPFFQEDHPPAKPGEHPDDWSRRMHEELQRIFMDRGGEHAVITCGMNSHCDIHPNRTRTSINGTRAEINTPAGTVSISSPLVGTFNLRNMLCSIGIGVAHHEKTDCLQKGLEKVKTIPGRLERILTNNAGTDGPAVFVDYAHTPDALENVLATLRDLVPGRLVCVFGCGGDRDPGKRPLMGEIASRLSSVVLATSDNPRSESPEAILRQIEEGIRTAGLRRTPGPSLLRNGNGCGYDIITDRHAAIRIAIRNAAPADVILISGKGHEDYQIHNGKRIFFDDRIEASMQLSARGGGPFSLKLEWIRQITGANLLFPVQESINFRTVSTDTRTIQAGDLFVALQGETFDGRMFAEKAVDSGAAGLLINLPAAPGEPILDFEPTVPVLLVPDTVTALGQLAGAMRHWQQELLVIALTGSSGKTTVKEMTAAILSQNHAVLKTEGNFNNLIGLPKTLLGLKPEHEIAVLEMGMNRPGEIARLTEIADPDIACIINIQEAHLEGLGDINGVARAKNELFAGLKPGGRIALNLDDKVVSSLGAGLTQEKISFGHAPEAFVRAADIKSLGEDGMGFSLHIGDESTRVAIRALGAHNVTNSLAAAAMAYAAGAGIEEIGAGLGLFVPYDKRTNVELLPGGIKVLNDSYNANPASMLAALKTLATLKKGHRAVAVLGDMLELGAKSDSAHGTLGKSVAELDIDYLAVFGSQMEHTVINARNTGMTPDTARHFNSKNDLASWLLELIENDRIGTDDWLLVKGSRGMRMEEIIDLLRTNSNRIKAAGS